MFIDTQTKSVDTITTNAKGKFPGTSSRVNTADSDLALPFYTRVDLKAGDSIIFVMSST